MESTDPCRLFACHAKSCQLPCLSPPRGEGHNCRMKAAQVAIFDYAMTSENFSYPEPLQVGLNLPVITEYKLQKSVQQSECLG